ncbi:MAG: hypothetical protein AAFV78_18925, partial [Bacteroidota bacterium]
PNDPLGFGVAINGGGTRIVASAHPANFMIPSVCVYDRVLGNWVQVGSDIGSFWLFENAYSIDMSDDGQIIVVGDPDAIIPFNFPGGIVNVFRWNGADWGSVGGPGTIADYADYGADVAISGDGSRIAVGDPSGSVAISSNGPGYVAVSEWNGTSWVDLGNKLSGSIGGEQFGTAVALSEDGNRLIVGAGGLYNFNNTYYEENDMATVTYITPEGCDLTYRLDFTPIIVDTAVIVSGQSFVSPALNATFQWIDCQTNLPIPGANQNFYPPTISGQYAVIIQQNGCQDTSAYLPFERTPSSIDPQTEI